MDAWWRPLVDAIYKPVLGDDLFAAIDHINPVDYLPTDGPDTYYYGWYSYVQKDLRRCSAQRGARAASRVATAAAGQLRALPRDLAVDTLARGGAARSTAETSASRTRPRHVPGDVPQTCDQLQFTAAGAVDRPPMPWQDRGSFQQAVSVGG